MDGRSKSQANELANRILANGELVTEANVVAVLSLWRFKNTTDRQNVMPAGQVAIFSDTFGLGQSHTGRVAPTPSTRKYKYLYALLCRYLKDHIPQELERFVFSSISVNYAYAAKVHRDSGNVGPSVATSLGPFIGGELMCWPHDDGRLSLESLLHFKSERVDTHSKLVLFDGTRAHAVAPYFGERYSLVYFTHVCYKRAPDMSFLTDAGAPVPTEATLNYLISRLAPAMGYSRGCKAQSIEGFLGRTQRPTMIQWAALKGLSDVSDDAASSVLSYVLTPDLVSTIGALSRRFRKLALSPYSWKETAVDASTIRPAGCNAHRHFLLWDLCAYVVNGQWALSNVSLLMSKVCAWRWLKRDGSEFIQVGDQHVLVSQFPSGSNATLDFRLSKLRGRVAIGISSSREPTEILGKDCGVTTMCGFVGRGHGFEYNKQRLGKAPTSIKLSDTRITFRCAANLEMIIDGVIRSSTAYDGVLNRSLHYYAFVLFGERPVGVVRPCWGRRE